MKKIVLTFGLISGALMALFIFTTMPLVDRIGMDRMVFVVYTWMVLAFMLVFFGVRSYRENVGGGTITFGRAFAVGILIAIISSLCYVVAWQILYYSFMPDFFEKYSAHVIEKERASGANAATIQAKIQETEQLKQLVKNPFIHAALVLIEPFPVGLVITLVSSLILRKRKPAHGPPTAVQ